MNFYTVQSVEHPEFHVVAESYDEAATIFNIYHADRGTLPETFSVGLRRTEWLDEAAQAEIRLVLSAGLAGVAVWCAQGWRIFQPGNDSSSSPAATVEGNPTNGSGADQGGPA